MVVNTILRCLICEHCGVAICPAHAQGHLHNKHPLCKFKIDEEQFQMAVDEMDVEEELPEIAGGGPPMPEFAGLQCHKGLLCKHCNKVVGTESSMAKHYTNDHAEVQKPKIFEEVDYQQLHQGSGSGRTIFQVELQPRKDVPPDAVLVARLRAETDKAFEEDIDISDVNSQGINPWLLTTKWHLHVDGYEVAHLQGLVKPLHEKEAPRLVQLVEEYYINATALIDQTDDLTLQHLNTPDPAKMCVNHNKLWITDIDWHYTLTEG